MSIQTNPLAKLASLVSLSLIPIAALAASACTADTGSTLEPEDTQTASGEQVLLDGAVVPASHVSHDGGIVRVEGDASASTSGDDSSASDPSAPAHTGATTSTTMTDAGSTTAPAPAPKADAGSSSAASTALFPSYLAGTNLSGGEFGTVPGTFGIDYTYPTHAEIDHFVADGMKIFRFPFMWERLQPKLGQAFNATELARLTDIVTYATSKGAYAVVDPHNSSRYFGVIAGANGSTSPTTGDFAAFWSQMATKFGANDHVIFGLTNEPHDMKTELWLTNANAAIAAVRKEGASNIIFVPGNGFTGAWSWTSGSDYGTANSTVMLGVVDPLNRWAYEVHQYFDSDGSGTHLQCTSASGSSHLTDFTAWLKKNGKHAFLAELAASSDPTCKGVVQDALSYLDANRDVWLGWSWWSAGPWWHANYMFALEPTSAGVDQPIMATLKLHF